MKRFIKTLIKESLQVKKWYHGTPDSRVVGPNGKLTPKYSTLEYIDDLDSYKQWAERLQDARNTDEKLYFKLLDEAGKYKKQYKFVTPLFLTDKYVVAKTYADPRRAFDYQNSDEKVFEVDAPCGKNVDIIAIGDKFRSLDAEKVVKGFVNAGIPEQDIREAIEKFNYYSNNKNLLSTMTISALGNWFKFDCIDVEGVYDSYNVGNVMSTVRIVLNPNDATFIV